MPLLPQGLYWGRLVEIGTDRLGNDNRTPYVYVVWELTHRAVGEDWIATEPIHRESRWWVTEKAEPYTMDRLARLGFNGDFDHPAFDASPHPERDGVQLICRHTRRDGQEYEEWDLADMRAEREREPWDAELKRQFRAKYRTHMASQKRPKGGPPAPPRPQSPEPDTSPIRDDEIPMDEPADVPEEEIPF